ncbi:hypothetical protein FQN50_001376 [Emmonsiellopsis sp. PD_5]|nr:hypothetical protein FQN50_001376 [Emmonsiellopsis sp. PD_5]
MPPLLPPQGSSPPSPPPPPPPPPPNTPTRNGQQNPAPANPPANQNMAQPPSYTEAMQVDPRASNPSGPTQMANQNNYQPPIPAPAQPPAGPPAIVQSAYIRQLEFHCLSAAQRFWQTHRPQPILRLLYPNPTKPAHHYRPGNFWQAADLSTHPAFRDLEQPISALLRQISAKLEREDGARTLRDFLSRIADLDWEVVMKKRAEMAQQQQAQGGMVMMANGNSGPVPPTSIPNTISNGSNNDQTHPYPAQFTNIMRLRDLHQSCEIVMKAVGRANNMGNVDGRAVLSPAEFRETIMAAGQFVSILDGEIERRAVGEVWDKFARGGMS